MKKLLFCFGTRPEAIKLAPMILDAKKFGFDPLVCLTGQHKELIEPINEFFGIKADVDLGVMTAGQSLHALTAKILTSMEKVLLESQPAAVVVQGDTTSAMAGALAAFYLRIPIIHIEAGLRTETADNPFPEEMNRRLISRMARFHFAPTELAAENLKRDGIVENILVTGNTGIDALRVSADRLSAKDSPVEINDALAEGKLIVLATVHRRENFENLDQIFEAMVAITQQLPNIRIVLPVHRNPNVQARAQKWFANASNVHLTEPLRYEQMIAALKACSVVLTDSGGLQEEAPYFNKPVLVMRTSTERLEGLAAGTSRLVGNTKTSITQNVLSVLTNASEYESFQGGKHPYGDGYATERIYNLLSQKL